MKPTTPFRTKSRVFCHDTLPWLISVSLDAHVGAMLKHLKRFERYAFVVFLAISVGAFAYGVWLAMTGQPSAAKWLATSGLLATATGVFQLEVSGLIEKILDRYGDETRYPRGPPSYITRQIVDDADRPIRTWIRDVAFFTPKTGFGSSS